MADGTVRVFPDSTGKIIDTEAIPSGATTVQRQRIRIGGAGLEDLATVTNGRLDVNVESGGTAVDVSTDPSADGTISLTAGPDILVTYAHVTGTLHITQWTWVADRQCSFRLQVYDNGVLTSTMRVMLNSGDRPAGSMELPTPIQVAGIANRTIRIVAQIVNGSGGEAGASLNGYII